MQNKNNQLTLFKQEVHTLISNMQQSFDNAANHSAAAQQYEAHVHRLG